MFDSSAKTNSFFFQDKQFIHLENWLMQKRRTRISLLSLGCGRGQEAYSIALVCERAKSLGYLRAYNIDIVDTDPIAVQHSRKGQYPVAALDEIPDRYRDFVKVEGSTITFSESVTSQLQFLTGNIFQAPFGEKQLYHAVFCRQMLARKKSEIARRMIQDISGVLQNDGLLFLSDGDKEFLPTLGFENQGNSVYVAVLSDKVVSLSRSATPSGMNVLMIEDDFNIRNLIADYIRSLHVHVVSVSNVEEARIALNDKTFDLVITDFLLPDGNAESILKFLRHEKKRNDMVVVMSGFSSQEMNRELAAYGIMTTIQKPIQPSEISQLLMRIKKVA